MKLGLFQYPDQVESLIVFGIPVKTRFAGNSVLVLLSREHRGLTGPGTTKRFPIASGILAVFVFGPSNTEAVYLYVVHVLKKSIGWQLCFVYSFTTATVEGARLRVFVGGFELCVCQGLCVV